MLLKETCAKLSSLSKTVYRSGLEEADFFYQPVRWAKPGRFIVIRRPIPEEPSEQLTLFSIGSYSYQVFVTDLKMKPLNVWRFYNFRAAVELIIKELKADYLLAKIPTRYFAANEAYFHLLLCLQPGQLVQASCLPPSAQSWTLKNLRAQILFVPGELVRTHNKPVLKFSGNYWYKDNIAYAMKQLKALRI